MLFLLLFLVPCVWGNLEGPFLLWGPLNLGILKRSALASVGQDELTKLYGQQAAIVVFKNQDSTPLSQKNLPRLSKLLDGCGTSLILPQDFLDVHPDYIKNDTQVLTLVGPWSERDAQITETFARLQDIYGKGKVLGILGNSVSQDADSKWVRSKRGAQQDTTTEESSTERPSTKNTPRSYSLFNATGPAGNGILLYSSGWPTVRWPDGTTTVLDTPVGEPTVKPTKLYTILVVKFAHENTKITVEFSFKQSLGWWSAVGAEVRRGLEPTGLSLRAPVMPLGPLAVIGRSYHCPLQLVYSSDDAALTLPDVQMQPYMYSTERFSDAFDCIGFTSVPIWAGLGVAALMFVGFSLALLMILDIKVMDQFENSKRQLTITVAD